MVKKVIFLVALITLVIIIYSNHFFNTFQFDDSIAIENNIYIKNPGNIPSFFTDSSTYAFLHRYRPIGLATFAIDYQIGRGLNPLYFHLDMFFWFLAQLIIMFFLFRQILRKTINHAWTDWFSLIAVAWYGMHTANAETINYISARYDSLSTLCVITSLYLFIVFPKKRRYCIYLLPVTTGMFIKEQAVMFAPILFVYVLLFENNKSFLDLFGKKGLSLIKQVFQKTYHAFIVCSVLGIFVLVMQTKTYTPVGIPFFNYLITQPWVLLRYFLLFFVPINLSPDTDWKALNSVFDERVFVGLGFIMIMLFIAIKISNVQEKKPISFGIIWFFLSLLPTSSFIPIPEITNDHRMFFPFVGLALGVVWSIGLFLIKTNNEEKTKFPFKVSLLLILVIVLGTNCYGVWQRNKVWHTRESLWYDVTIKSPQNGRGLMNYGLIQMEKGNYDIALTYFNNALLYVPYYPYLHINLGILENAKNNVKVAEEHFLDAIKYGPLVNVAYYYYADFLERVNRQRESVYYAEHSLVLDPTHLPSRHLLINLYHDLNEKEKLKKIIAETLHIFPQDSLSQKLTKDLF